MKKVVEEIQALHDREGGEIEYFIADASELNYAFEGIAKSYQHLNSATTEPRMYVPR